MKRASVAPKLVLGSVVVTVGLYITLLVFVLVRQDLLVFPAPETYEKRTPLSAGMPFEDLHIPVARSEQIHAWWIPSAQPSKSAVVYFHGNGYTLEQSVDIDALTLHSVGANLLMIDYRGYGSSTPGDTNEQKTYEDARAALRYVVDSRHIPVENVTIIGRSIGSGVAAQLALENPHACGLVLLSPYTNVADVARETWFYRILPLSLIARRNQFDTLSKIGSIRVPLLVIVGSADVLTPPWMAQALIERATSPKRLVILQNADHIDVFAKRRSELVSSLARFVAPAATR